MAKAITSKMITVKSRGFVTTSRGRFMSPIRAPYQETIDRIWSMLTQDRADVWEKLPNGKEVQLNAQNFDQDNSTKVEKVVEKTAEPVAPVAPESASKSSIDPVPTVAPATTDANVEQPVTSTVTDTKDVATETTVEETAKVEDAATTGTVEATQGTTEEKKENTDSSKNNNYSKKDKKAESAALEVKAEEA